MVSAITSATRKGVLIKGSSYVEEMRKIKAVIFDKTGTLTEGKLKLNNIEMINDNYSEEDMIKIAASLETKASHPIGKAITNYAEEKNISSVDYLIITHYDKDHVGGAAKVINNIEVKNVLAPDYEESSDEMDKYNKALSEAGITPKLLTGDLSFTLDNAEYTVYAPKQSYYGEDNDNDFSLVTKITHGNNVLLFTGDAMEQRLEEIMDIGDCDFLKVPYHGRSLDNLDDFLSAVTPEKAVVCTSKSEFSADTQKELINRNIEYYATCFNGKIEVKSDGNNIDITAEKGA